VINDRIIQENDDVYTFDYGAREYIVDGNTAYAVNPALGVIDEIDLQRMSVRRVAAITVSRTGDDALAALGRLVFPVAYAKRYVSAGALLSPDERTIYAAGFKGLAAIDRQLRDGRRADTAVGTAHRIATWAASRSAIQVRTRPSPSSRVTSGRHPSSSAARLGSHRNTAISLCG